MNMAIGAPENETPTATGVSRRTLVKGAAWAVPVIALAAPVPAFAASRCSPSTNFDGLAVGTSPTVISFYDVQGQPTGVTASLGWTSGGQGGDNTPGNTGQVLQTTQAPQFKFIEIQMVSSLNQGDYVELTLTFNQAVSGLSFKIIDIDKSVGPGNVAWVDNVQIVTGGYTYALGSNIQGAGTQANPFNAINWGDTPIVSGQGDVRITYPGSVSQVVVRYVAAQNGNAQSQHVGLGNLSYDICAPVTTQRSAQRSAIAPQLQASVTTGEPTFVGDGTFDN